jgi:hypothetical protein
VPPGAPPPGAPQQSKTPLYVAIGVVAVIALVGIILVVTGGGDDDEPATPAPGTPTTVAPTDGPDGTAAPPDGSDAPAGDATVEVIDQGFSNFASGFDDDERSASYGFVIENTGDGTATDIRISVSAYDADDNALATDSQTIYVLRPGQKMGVGDEFYGDDLASDVARLDVQISETSDPYWAEEVPDEGRLTAEGVATSADDYGMTTTFTAKSTFGVQIDNPYAYAVYRNAAGEIIGGSTGWLDFVPANGTTAGKITSYDVIPDVDATEVFVDTGYL